ncbi:MAG: hypothetical protein U9R50_00220, partial [Campylobacterota bacterium]|nr:hypothetical protein [Campylobacterota bacterium]
MNFEKNYKNNLNAIKKIDKNLYDLLGNIKETIDFEVYAIEETFDILDKKHRQIIYDKEPSEFVENKIQSFIKNYNEYPF